MLETEISRRHTNHEIVTINTDIEVRFYLSADKGSYVSPHWHNSLELVYLLEGSIEVIIENKREFQSQGG